MRPTCSHRLVLATTGEPAQLLGIALVLERLSGPAADSSWISYTRSVLAPRSEVPLIQSTLARLLPHEDVALFPADASLDDPYFIKLGLADLLTQSTDADVLLYLDYDHLVLNPRHPPLAAVPGVVLVSSEHARFNLEDRGRLRFALGSACAGGMSHYNTSLILGRCGDIRTVADQWMHCYRVVSHLPVRHREEIAFSLASNVAGVPLQPCVPTFQGNFRHARSDCAIFHYGGVSRKATVLKRMLQRLALRHAAHTSLVQIDRVLTDTLKGLLGRPSS